MKAVFATAATLLASTVLAMTEVSPGVFSVPLKKKYVKEHPQLQEHLNLKMEHPRVGNWSDSELWNMEVKMPVEDLDGYMYAM